MPLIYKTLRFLQITHMHLPLDWHLDEGWKDVLQLLKEQDEKMERLAKAFSIIQQGMLRNNPHHVTDSVNEAIEDAIKVSTRDGQSYADILKEIKVKVDPRRVGLDVLSIRRTRREDVLLVLKKGGDDSAFRKELDRAVGERVGISALVSSRSLEIRDLDEIVEKEEVMSSLCLALGRPALDESCGV